MLWLQTIITETNPHKPWTDVTSVCLLTHSVLINLALGHLCVHVSQLRPVLHSALARGDFPLSHQVSRVTFRVTAAPQAPRHQLSSSSPPAPAHHPSSKRLKHPAVNLRSQRSSRPPRTRLSNVQRIPSCLSLHSTEGTAAAPSSSPAPAKKGKTHSRWQNL